MNRSQAISIKRGGDWAALLGGVFVWAAFVGVIPCASANTTRSQSDCLFDWAQRAYPATFFPAQTSSIALAPYYFRAYPASSTYLGISSDNDHLYYVGPLSGHRLFDLGPAPVWTDKASCTTSASSSFSLTSSMAVEGGAMPSTFTCDGAGASIPLAWSNVPEGVKSFALLMTTITIDGNTKWNWVLYNIPASVSALAMNEGGTGTFGAADNGAGNAYSPPCSKDPSMKTYTYTLYALSDNLSFNLPAAQITGPLVTETIQPLVLGSAVLNVTYARVSATGTTTSPATGTPPPPPPPN